MPATRRTADHRLNQKAFRELADLLRTHRPIAFLGAGVSVGEGYPTWTQLLDRLEKKAGATPRPPKYMMKLRNLDDMQWRADEYAQLIGAKGMSEFFKAEFGPNRRKTGPVLRNLIELNFGHVITTNYDTSFERATRKLAPSRRHRAVEWSDAAGLQSFFAALSAGATRPHLVYLHGRYANPESCVLTEAHYVNRYVRSDEATKRLFALFMTQPAVFIGF